SCKTSNTQCRNEVITNIFKFITLGDIRNVQNIVNKTKLDVNCDIMGRTLLIESTKNKRAQIVAWLLSRNAKKELTDVKGNRALHWAASLGSTEIIDILIAAKAYKNARALSGETALHFAALNGHLNVVLRLLDYEVDAEIKDALQRSAYDVAIANNHNALAAHIL
ncbi:hypothetical protein BgiMline_007366, partial [Biomphalaria glabrata]